MNSAQSEKGVLNQIWTLFASIRLTVTLLILIAGFSIIGTLIPQNADPAMYRHVYGEAGFRLFSFLNIFNMYHSWWFQLLIILLAMNIIVCSFDRLTATWKIIFVKKPKFSRTRFEKSSGREEFVVSQPIEILMEAYGSFVARHFGHKTIEQNDSGLSIFAEKWRWTRIGVYAVHLSVVLLLFGALIGSIAGFDGYVNISEGEAADHIQVRNSNQTIALGFEIRCDDFFVSFYDSGAPEEFRSALSILDKGRVVLQKDIIVNDPLRYEGINVFQQSYGPLQPKDITLSFTRMSTGQQHQIKVQMDETVSLPDNMGDFVIRDYQAEYKFMGQHTDGAFMGTMTLKGGQVVDVIVPFPFPVSNMGSPMAKQLLSMLQTSRTGDLPDRVQVDFMIRKTGKTHTIDMTKGQRVRIPENRGEFVLDDFSSSYEFRGHNLGNAFIGTLFPRTGDPQKVVLPLKFTQFDKMRQGDVMISIRNFEKKQVSTDLAVSVLNFENKYYTGLQVTKDPGVWVVYTGFITMIIGIYITFFMSHQQIYIHMAEKNNQTRVTVAGIADKNKLGMQTKVTQIAKHLKQIQC